MKHFLSLCTFFIAASVAACSGTDVSGLAQNGSTEPSAALNSCYAQCTKRSHAPYCAPGAIDLKQCKTGCDAVVTQLDEGCQAKAKAVYDCGAAASWTCADAGMPTLEGDGCKAKNTAFAPCFR